METLANVLEWHAQNKDIIDFVKDIVFAIGAILTFVSVYELLKFLARRKTLNKKQEMENDLKLYGDISKKLKEYVDEYDAKPKKLRDIGVRLLYIKNYPYKLDKDGFPQMLYYYFLSEQHKASGYISGKGLFVMEHLWFLSEAVYYNQKNGKWFVDKTGLSYKRYKELKHKQLVRRIPFANIYGYDFNSDWADKGEPVFYTKYKYYSEKLYADELDAVTIDQEFHLAHKVSLQKSKRTKRTRTQLRRLRNRVRAYVTNRKIQKKIKSK
jgi:hypothetical protein